MSAQHLCGVAGIFHRQITAQLRANAGTKRMRRGWQSLLICDSPESTFSYSTIAGPYRPLRFVLELEFGVKEAKSGNLVGAVCPNNVLYMLKL